MQAMKPMMMQLSATLSPSHLLFNNPPKAFPVPNVHASQISSTPSTVARRALSLLALTTSFSGLMLFSAVNSTSWSKATNLEFVELPNSGGVRALDLRIGDGDAPVNGDKVTKKYSFRPVFFFFFIFW